MNRQLLFAKRRKARELHQRGWSINRISNYFLSHWNSVKKWVNMEDVTRDNRGWEKSKLRKYTRQERQRVIEIRNELRKEESYFFGSDVILENYKNRYPEERLPTLYFIEKTIREEGLCTCQKNEQVNRGAEYMNYPKDTLDKLGKVVMGIDFVGPRYIEDRTKPVHFLARKYIRPLKYGMMDRIEGQTTDEALSVLLEDFKSQPMPDVIRLDNDPGFGALSTHKRCIGRFLKVVLNLGITPVFSAYRQPWNNGTTEGYNSLFSRKLWNRLRFSDEDEIDVEIKEFNLAYQKYNDLVANHPKEESLKERILADDYQLPKRYQEGLARDPRMSIYWLRVVRQNPEATADEGSGFIEILQEEIEIPEAYVNQYTLSKLDVLKEKLTIQAEDDDGQMQTLKTVDFALKNANYLSESK